jgi:hypothetical protein
MGHAFPRDTAGKSPGHNQKEVISMNIHWTSLAERFPDEEQCLASFIAWQAAEVISLAKPANLVNVFDRELACGRNIHTLWQVHKQTVFSAVDIESFELQKKGERLLVLIYQPEALGRVLQKNIVQKTLRTLGYPRSLYGTLTHLKSRMQGDEFPHEVGFFLGYPIKDVLCFMGLSSLPLVAQGPWKMYGKLETSLATLKAHHIARNSIIECLLSGINPLQLLKHKLPEIQQPA